MDELLQLCRTARIPNGLLFTGAPGTGKSRAAHFLAKACNCTRGPGLPCEACNSCKKLNSGMHPDFISLDLEEGKKNITISQIRDMGRRISARPNEAVSRVVCIRSADKMNVQAQNALLKVLEEPPDKTFFILCAADGAALLPTIHSRCRKIRFSLLSLSSVFRMLTDTHGLDPETAHIAAHTLGPDVDLILASLSVDQDGAPSWMDFRRRLLERILDLISGQGPLVRALDLSRHLAASQDRLPDAMAIIRTLVRDLALFRYSPEKIVNLDFFPAFEDISQVHRESTFLEWAERFQETQRRLEANCGPRLALDAFFLSLSPFSCSGHDACNRREANALGYVTS